MERQKNYVGIDVAKAGMDIAVCPTDESWAISNDEAGIRRLVSRLNPNPPKSRGISAGAWVKDAARWRCGYDADAEAF